MQNPTSRHLQAGEGDPNPPPPPRLPNLFPPLPHPSPRARQNPPPHRLDLPGYALSDKPLDVAYDYDFFADMLDAFLDALDIRDHPLPEVTAL